ASSRSFVSHWHPHQLRHSHGTEVRRRFGLEAAQAARGHAQAKVTEVYAQRLRRRACEAQPQIPGRKVQRGGTVYHMAVRPHGAAGADPAADALGIHVPEARVPVFAAVGDFQEARDLFERLARVLDRIAQGPAGEGYRLELIRTTQD